MSVDRRDFLRIAGAHAGLLAVGGCASSGSSRPGSGDALAAVPHLAGSPDFAVIGAGNFGVWTAYHLRAMGASVLLIDAWGPGNSRSTSGDETRGVRTSYGDRPHGEQWMRWASRAIGRWQSWDDTVAREQGTRLFFTTGDVILRSSWDSYITQTRTLFEKVGIRHAVLPVDEVRYRWPVIDTSAMQAAVYEPDAGVLRSRRACESVAAEFRRLGGAITVARATPTYQEDGQLQGVQLDDGRRITAGTYVFACGPWLGKVFPEVMARRLRTPIGSVFYLGMPMGNHAFEFPNLPSWSITPTTGWPSLPLDNRGFRVRMGGAPASDPDLSQRTIDPSNHERLRTFLGNTFPLMRDAPILETRSCHYEGTPTRNFTIAPHPDMSNVWIAGGGNAESFKFGPVLGKYIAQRLVGRDEEPELAAAFALSTNLFDEPGAPRPSDASTTAPAAARSEGRA